MMSSEVGQSVPARPRAAYTKIRAKAEVPGRRGKDRLKVTTALEPDA